MKRLALSCLVVLGTAPSCTSKRSPDSPPPAPSAVNSRDLPAAAAPQRPVALDVTRNLDGCALGYRGVLMDFGDPSMRADLHPGSLARGQDEVVEQQGASWLRVRSRVLSATFYWPAAAGDDPQANAYVEARVRAVAGRTLSVAIDGKAVGAWSMAKGETRVVAARASPAMTLAAGAHELTLHFAGGPRVSEGPLADVDWVHVGTGDPEGSYAAPTHRDAAVSATVGGTAMRAVSLHARGFVRCSAWIPANTTLEASLATVGGSDADVEANLLRDRRAPIVLGTAHVAGRASAWTQWSVPVTGLDGDGGLASIELVVKRSDPGTRVLLGEPRIVVAGLSPLAVPPPASAVVLVVLGSTSARALAPWDGPHAVPELTRLAASATTFVSNRASSSLASAVVASMLTGLPPRAHSLDDPDARLPDTLTTVEEACRQGGVATAMFTANPTTGAAFGFDRGWDAFVMHDPVEEGAATLVFDDAAAWVEAHKADRFFVVVHARGGHPPWDATPEELRSMPPEGYLGVVEPRRAAEALSKVRRHAGRFKEDDRTRAFALYDHAIDAHDVALGRLQGAIHGAGRDGDTAVIITGDVAASEAQVPFGDADTLDEPLLATPLVIRWPGAEALTGRRVVAPSSPIDLARTILAALGLSPPEAFEGIDLATAARGSLVPEQRPLLATRGARFSVRWGPYVLMGTRERENRVCDLSLDPSCVADVRMTSPLAVEPLHRWAVDALVPDSPPRQRVPAVIDERAAAALVRWGRAGDDRDKDDRR